MAITVAEFVTAFAVLEAPENQVGLKPNEKELVTLRGQIKKCIENMETALANSTLPETHPARATIQKQVKKLKDVKIDDATNVAAAKKLLSVLQGEEKKIKTLLANDKFIRRDKKAHDYLERFNEVTEQLRVRELLNGKEKELDIFRENATSMKPYADWKEQLEKLETGDMKNLDEGVFNKGVGKLKDDIKKHIQSGVTAIEAAQTNATNTLKTYAEKAKLLAGKIAEMENKFSRLKTIRESLNFDLSEIPGLHIKTSDPVARGLTEIQEYINTRFGEHLKRANATLDKLYQQAPNASASSADKFAQEQSLCIENCNYQMEIIAKHISTLSNLGNRNLRNGKLIADMGKRLNELTSRTMAKKELESDPLYKSCMAVIKEKGIPNELRDVTKLLECAENLAALERKIGKKEAVDIGNGRKVEIDPREIPNIEGVSPQRAREVVQKLSAKVKKGQEIVQRVLAEKGDILAAVGPGGNLSDIPPTKANLASITWFIKAVAEGKASNTFERGAMTVPDPKGNLRHYMDLCSENYLRGSSHLEKEQKKEDGIARGLDFYGGNIQNDADLDEMLPMGMNTLLTQTVRGSKGDRMLYFKTETEGARRGNFSETKFDDDHFFGNIQGGKRAGGGKERDFVKSRQIQDGDFDKAKEHFHNLIRKKVSLWQNEYGFKELPQYREKMSTECEKAYKALQKVAAKETPAMKLPDAKSYAQMIEIVQTELPEQVSEELAKALEALVAALEKSIPGFSKGINSDNQFGEEVQITANDLGFTDIAH